MGIPKFGAPSALKPIVRLSIVPASTNAPVAKHVPETGPGGFQV